MKALIFLFPILLINACGSQSGAVVTTDSTTETQTQTSGGDCPDGGNCTVEVLKNKSLSILTDGTGMLYPSVVDGDNTVVVFTFAQKGPEGTADGDYSETIHFEIPVSTRLLELEDADLQNAKVLFGKQCYCKGEAGFYKIDRGALKMKRNENAIQFDLQFSTDKTSHKVSHISKTVKL